MYNDNNDLDGRLNADDQAFYDEFNRDAETTGSSSWGKDRAKAKRRDITNRQQRLPMEMLEQIPMGSWERGIIDAIDMERGRRESNDIAPGIIKDGRIYRCSKFIPGHGAIKASFIGEDEARAWMDKVNAAYNRLVR